MAKTPTKPDDELVVITPEQQALSFLKANKTSHYNFEETITDKTRSSSLTLTGKMDGGIQPGAHRAVGITTGGKTSCTLDFMHFFLKGNPKGKRGFYVKSEGRLSDDVKARSGITFTTDATQWKDGTCFILEANEFEAVFGMMGDLIRNNPTKTRYFFIIDSMDMMAKKADLEKGLEDAAQVAGGALITSVFLKKTSTALAKRGHICWFISQLRESIKIGNGPSGPPRQGGASGGHAVEHVGDWVLEFLPRWQKDIIREDPADLKSKIVGHMCQVRIVKSNNETYGQVVEYPIKYGRKNASSVWVEREIGDLMFEQWKLFTKAGSWLSLIPSALARIKEHTGVDFPAKVQGINAVYDALEANPTVTAYLYDKCISGTLMDLMET